MMNGKQDAINATFDRFSTKLPENLLNVVHTLKGGRDGNRFSKVLLPQLVISWRLFTPLYRLFSHELWAIWENSQTEKKEILEEIILIFARLIMLLYIQAYFFLADTKAQFREFPSIKSFVILGTRGWFRKREKLCCSSQTDINLSVGNLSVVCYWLKECLNVHPGDVEQGGICATMHKKKLV